MKFGKIKLSLIMQYMSMIVFALFCIVVDKGKVVSESQTTTSWELVKPAFFNEDVILKCHIKNCCLGTQWHGGKKDTLLTSDLLSYNKAKYAVRWEADSSSLIIKSFEFEDGDTSYTCLHSSHNCSRNLTINGNNFVLKPTEETIKKNFAVRNGFLNASVEFLKVYPAPVCRCTFQDEDISDNIRSNFNNTTNRFFNGKITIYHEICRKEKSCHGTIKIHCKIGMHQHEFLHIVDITVKHDEL